MYKNKVFELLKKALTYDSSIIPLYCSTIKEQDILYKSNAEKGPVLALFGIEEILKGMKVVEVYFTRFNPYTTS